MKYFFIIGLLSGRGYIPFFLQNIFILFIVFYGIFIKKIDLKILSLALMLEPVYRYTSSEILDQLLFTCIMNMCSLLV